MKSVNLLIAAAAFAFLTQACGSSNEENAKAKPAVKAKVETLELTTVPKKFHYTGTVSSVNQSTLSTRIMGQISQVLVREGDMVKKGQLLVSIRSNDIQAKEQQVEANIIQAKAAYKHAKDDFERIQALFNSKSATQKELDDITVHLKMTKAQLAAAQKAKDEVVEMLSYADIRAPYDGVITQKFVDSGDMANPGMPLLAIEAPGLFEVIAKIPESEIYKVEKGDVVEVHIDACKEMISGSITHVSPSSRFSGSQFDARISLLPTEEQKQAIRSGVFAHVNHLKGEEQKLLVPADMIVERGQLKGIWTVSQANKALLRWVRLGKLYGDKIEVLSGLSDGNQLVVASEGRLFDGAELQLN
ncbi:efflux RND transporter periplasmic adaptor subunit [Carboxylicivirga mesophila]|uniref:Efflux RND transporter periplasmic adaptor subunit n=1 Tax=Carboxylicivirga mesophila TaxID=1166478 RepID=A0ABS5KAN1_9BACT|nr:efflux RND transporter periplasmic adaptor subunit [Carboxylicivirga mesophila]MBS2212083.1 efflux RND transporter periplasmic adaptor subunit [Carboxylicivirga mesophila]